MRYISLFSGIEAASVAWQQLGWEPMAFSEIEPFPCELLAQRFPDVPNLGDITKIDWSSYYGKCDITIGGSPCQSFSIAGNRAGLAGESGLMFEFIRAVREVMPRYFVWENVPGALSCEKGAAFGQLLHEMDVLGYGLAWRVLDAQFFGVAQRRRRVFLVGCLGDPERAFEILFERESVCWDYPSNRDKRKTLADLHASRNVACDPSILGKDVGSVDGIGSGSIRGKGPEVAHAYTLQVRCGCEGGGKGALIQEDVSATLSTSNIQMVFQPVYCMVGTNGRSAVDENVCGTLIVHGDPPFAAYKDNQEYIVRKLMPVECERLQGFPDGWTDIVFKGKPAKDGMRYKALGNSMAVPCILWIGKGIAGVER